MPATERAFRDFEQYAPAGLYIDTDFFLDYLIPARANHIRVVPFVQSVAASGTTTVYVSPLSWLEFTSVVRRDDFRRALDEEDRRLFSLDRWDDALVRKRYLEYFVQRFEDLLKQLSWAEIALTEATRHAALGLVLDYYLGSLDSLHVAAAWSIGVRDFASFDKGYRRVDGLNLWNDRIYPGLPSQG